MLIENNEVIDGVRAHFVLLQSIFKNHIPFGKTCFSFHLSELRKLYLLIIVVDISLSSARYFGQFQMVFFHDLLLDIQVFKFCLLIVVKMHSLLTRSGDTQDNSF